MGQESGRYIPDLHSELLLLIHLHFVQENLSLDLLDLQLLMCLDLLTLHLQINFPLIFKV